MTNKNWSTAYCNLKYASTEKLLTNRLIAEAFIVMFYIEIIFIWLQHIYITLDMNSRPSWREKVMVYTYYY